MRGGTGLGGESATKLEITGVKQAAMLLVDEEGLGRAKDVAGGVKGDGGAGGEGCGLAELQDMFPPLPGNPHLHQAGRPPRTDHLAVQRRMVAVRVGDERAFDRKVSVQPPADLGQVHSGAELYIPGH